MGRGDPLQLPLEREQVSTSWENVESTDGWSTCHRLNDDTCACGEWHEGEPQLVCNDFECSDLDFSVRDVLDFQPRQRSQGKCRECDGALARRIGIQSIVGSLSLPVCSNKDRREGGDIRTLSRRKARSTWNEFVVVEVSFAACGRALGSSLVELSKLSGSALSALAPEIPPDRLSHKVLAQGCESMTCRSCYFTALSLRGGPCRLVAVRSLNGSHH